MAKSTTAKGSPKSVPQPKPLPRQDLKGGRALVQKMRDRIQIVKRGLKK